MARGTALALILLLSCTAGPSPQERPTPRAGPTAVPTRRSLPLGVIATISGPQRLLDRPLLDGMALAETEVNAEGGVAGRRLRLHVADDRGRQRTTARALDEALRGSGPAAVLVVGGAEAVARRREAIEARGRPVVLLGGDLYSSRRLFRQVFQAGPASLWEARVIARYLRRDRGHRRVAVVEDGRAGPFLAELGRQGVEPAAVGPLEDVDRLAHGAEALVARVALDDLDALLAALERRADPPQLVLPASLLRTDLPRLPPGTVAPGPYTWAPWARPIPRVRRFRASFERTIGRPPVGAEQEGYDAVRLLAAALEATRGRTGEPLVRALERNRPEGPTFSALPLVLGPDDHTLITELFLGLFAVAGPGEASEPWLDGVPWRPIIRTFAYDGERTNFAERDRPVFFPFWRSGRPSPKFHRSRWGIVTGRADPLH